MNIESLESSSGDNILVKNASWSFGGDVTNKFDSHVRKSVPQYDEGHHIVASLADFFLHKNSTVYEIGSSTGTLIQKIVERCDGKRLNAIGIDVEVDMVKHAKEHSRHKNIDFIHADVSDIELEKSDLIVAYYTIQFISPERRQQVISQIYDALNWGGAFIMFEKVRAPDARFQDIMTSMYLDYKLENGYTPEEILGKMRSLKGILEPFSTQGNLDLMKRAGFADVTTVMKHICFEGFLAIK